MDCPSAKHRPSGSNTHKVIAACGNQCRKAGLEAVNSGRRQNSAHSLHPANPRKKAGSNGWRKHGAPLKAAVVSTGNQEHTA
jgi:hypothetical protein